MLITITTQLQQYSHQKSRDYGVSVVKPKVTDSLYVIFKIPDAVTKTGSRTIETV